MSLDPVYCSSPGLVEGKGSSTFAKAGGVVDLPSPSAIPRPRFDIETASEVL